MSVQPSTTRTGVVEEFDEPVGLGLVRESDGTSWPFHCTAVADGSRDIAVDTPVTFRAAPARAGRFEAVDIVPR